MESNTIMSDIDKVLQAEIKGIVKRGYKRETVEVRQEMSALRKTLAEQRRRIKALERENSRLLRNLGKNRVETPVEKPEPAGDADEKLDKKRVTAKMLVALRARLGITQAELAKLVGVAGNSVYLWERKEGRLIFRGDTKARIVALRKLGKREVRERLEEMAG